MGKLDITILFCLRNYCAQLQQKLESSLELFTNAYILPTLIKLEPLLVEAQGPNHLKSFPCVSLVPPVLRATVEARPSQGQVG